MTIPARRSFITHVFAPNAMAALLLTLVVLGGGCSAPDTSPSPGMGDPYPAPLNDPQITIVSPELRPWLGFHPAIVVNNGEQPMQVEIPVRNLTNNRYFIDYRILFYSESGLELTPTMSWKFQPMEPKQTVRLKAKALDTSAVNYRLEVKWAK